MNLRGRIFWAAGLALTLSIAAAWWWIGRSPSTASLLTHLPHSRGIASIDLATLRAAGVVNLIAGSPTNEDADYKQFIAATGFDYRRDLDNLLVSFSAQEILAFAIGRFDFNKLEAFVKQSGGSCKDSLCRLPGSKPARQLSFYRVSRHVLALASSSDPEAALKLRSPVGDLPLSPLPADPIWVLVPPATLKDNADLSMAPRMLATALADTDQLLITIGASGQNYRAAVDAKCRTAAQATQIQKELEAATTLLNRLLEKDKLEPDPRSLTGVLAKGTFQTSGDRLTGTWPIERVFLESFAGSTPTGAKP